MSLPELPEINTIVNIFCESLKKRLMSEYKIEYSAEISEQLEYLILDSLTLVQGMTQAKPPGKFLWSDGKTTEKFDSSKHEIRSRQCDESGIIDLMIHPGYIEGKYITPAWVITKPQ